MQREAQWALGFDMCSSSIGVPTALASTWLSGIGTTPLWVGLTKLVTPVPPVLLGAAAAVPEVAEAEEMGAEGVTVVGAAATGAAGAGDCAA